MKYYITYFQNIRHIKDDSYILIDTSVWAPKWLDPSNGKKQYINENNLLIGIKEESFLMTEDEIPEEVESIIQDDFYDGTGFLNFLDNCKLTGTENECQKDIEEQFKDNLPITGITLIDDRVQGLFKLTKDELWKIHYIQCMHDDENVPSYEKALKYDNFLILIFFKFS